MRKYHRYKIRIGRPWIGTTVASLMLMATACGAAPQENESRPEPKTVTAEAGTRTHIVEIRQFKFWPEMLTIQEGDTVIWRNLDVVPHTATEKSREWDSGNLGKNDEWSFVAGSAGRHEYFCVYHPSMKGTIIIERQQRDPE